MFLLWRRVKERSLEYRAISREKRIKPKVLTIFYQVSWLVFYTWINATNITAAKTETTDASTEPEAQADVEAEAAEA